MTKQQPNDPERMARVAQILRQYPGVDKQPEASIRREAWHIVHYGTGARLTGRYEESRKQLAALSKLVGPLREFLEAEANLNRHALYDLEESGFLDFDGRDVHDIVELLRKAEIIPPRHRGRSKEYPKRVIADLAASAIMRLTGRKASYTTSGSVTTGPFVELMKALYSELGHARASTDTATDRVRVIAEAHRVRRMTDAEYADWEAKRHSKGI